MSSNSTTIGTVAPSSGSSKISGLAGQLSKLLSATINNATTLEVRTYTSAADNVALGEDGNPVDEDARLRAFTRVALDGDTSVCVPLDKSGEIDDVLWRLHNETVAQARADRAATLSMTVDLVTSLTGR